MTRWRIAALVLVVLTAAGVLWARQDVGQIVKARAYLSLDGLRPDSTFKLAIVLDIRKGSHVGAAVPTADWPSKLELRPLRDITFGPPQYPKETLKAFQIAGGQRVPVYEGTFKILVDGRVAKDAAPGKRVIAATFSYQACNDSQCFPPAHVTASVPTRVVAPGEPVSPAHPEVFKEPKSAEGGSADVGSAFGKGALLGFLTIFGAGLLLSLTPCVYPMIPVTIGYFGMQTDRRTSRVIILAALYILGLALTYSALGVAAALTGDMFGSALQHPAVEVGIALVLVALALSMFGLYEFKVPSWVASKSQDKRGAAGALFMGLLFGIVAAPCVGPVIVGLLVYVARVGSPLFGFLTFFILAVGMGTPFFFLATFSGSISRLPQAGMWMVSVRKVFGLLLLGAAIYYLTPFVATHISKQAAELALPVFIVLSGFYLGWFDRGIGKQRKVGLVRQLVGVVIVVLGAVLVVGALRQPAKLFEPYTEAAVARATAQRKPVMIDFTAAWCVYCKKLDRETFPAAAVRAEGRRFVWLQADQTEGSSPEVKARQEKYAIRGLPTIVFLDSRGREVERARAVGFIRPDQLVEKMRMVE
jgi:thiol:disulfide interchange protein DsbD